MIVTKDAPMDVSEDVTNKVLNGERWGSNNPSNKHGMNVEMQ